MFSVLLSVYKKEQPSYLQQSLESIFTQTLLPNEVVLVKDGPLTTELDQVVETYRQRHPELKVIPLPQNQGLGKALNEGLKHCSYDLVARMDTDDIAKPERFEKQVTFLDQHTEIDVVGALVEEFVGNPENIISIHNLPETPDLLYKYGMTRIPVIHPVVMFRKKAVLACGGYVHFPMVEDYCLWARMMVNGMKFYNIQEPLLYFRTSPDMFRRRSGLNYALTEARLQFLFVGIGYIRLGCFLKNLAIRFPVRLIPNFMRIWIYTYILRKHI